MKIPVVGMDPSLTNWGIAEAYLDLTTGYLSTPLLSLVQPDELKGKQVRVNSNDLHRAEQLASSAIEAARKSKIVFIEIPHGSQSARAMASYGICVGIISSIRALDIPIIEVNEKDVKFHFTGNKLATKQEMIAEAIKQYPDADFPNQKGRITAKAEHVADAIAAIHAGVTTPAFKNLMRLFAEI